MSFSVTALKNRILALYQRSTQEEICRRMQELEAIVSLSAALRIARDDKDMVPILLNKIMETMNAQDGAIALLDAKPGFEEKRDLYVVQLAKGSFAKAQGKVFPASALAHNYMDLQEPFLTNDLDKILEQTPLRSDADVGLAADGNAISSSTRSGALVALRSVTETLGFLVVGRRNGTSFSQEEASILKAFAEMAGNALHRARLLREIEANYLGIILSLAKAIDAKDTYTGNHSQRLAEMALAVGKALGINGSLAEDLHWGALLHDIGKIGVPDEILGKPGPLTLQEWTIMRRHPLLGAQILEPIPKLAGAARIVRYHHEWWNGEGYPEGLRGEAIPLGARILAVVDAYSAMTDNRVYRPAMTQAAALAELRRYGGIQFDPYIVDAFLKIVGDL